MYEGLNKIHYIKWNNKGRLDGVRKEKKNQKGTELKSRIYQIRYKIRLCAKTDM